MRTAIRASLVLLACLGCSATEPVPDTLPGTYALVTINGQSLQSLLIENGWGTQSAVLAIQPDGSFVETIVSQRPPGFEPAVQEATFTGTWSDAGASYDFLWNDARVFPMAGKLSGRTLTLRSAAGAERAYQK
jgi:uncharacterized protein YcfL